MTECIFGVFFTQIKYNSVRPNKGDENTVLHTIKTIKQFRL